MWRTGWQRTSQSLSIVCLATVNEHLPSIFAWLTASNGASQRDPILGRLERESAVERYLVGWRTASNYWLQLQLDAIIRFRLPSVGLSSFVVHFLDKV